MVVQLICWLGLHFCVCERVMTLGWIVCVMQLFDGPRFLYCPRYALGSLFVHLVLWLTD